jgi:hypothetical protein
MGSEIRSYQCRGPVASGTSKVAALQQVSRAAKRRETFVNPQQAREMLWNVLHIDGFYDCAEDFAAPRRDKGRRRKRKKGA